MARLYVNASVRKLSGNTFVEVTAMITSIQSSLTRPTVNVRSTVCDNCLILFHFRSVHRCRPANFWCPVKVNGHNSVRDN